MFYYLSRGAFLFLMLGVFSLLTSCASQSELDSLKSELEKIKNPQPPIVESPIQNPTVIYTPAPTPSTSIYGTGNGNNVMTPSNGYLTIQTKSANGKLCLRANASQSSNCLTEIPNGTSGIYYTNRFQSGDFVWYEVSYNNMFGYLRGDYVFI